MNKDEYRNEYMESGMRTAAWCESLGISQYQHRNYQTGRTKVPGRVSNIIEKAKMIEEIKNKSGA